MRKEGKAVGAWREEREEREAREARNKKDERRVDVVDVGPVRPRRKEGEKEVDEDESLGGEEEGGGVFRGREEREERGAVFIVWRPGLRKGERGERE